MNFVWSLTKWRDYETCPLMFHNKHILKNFTDTPGPAMARGRDVHKMFEESVKHGIVLPEEFATWESAVEIFDGRKDVFTEFKFGLDKNLQHTGFFSDTVWIRAALDVFVSDQRNPLLIDYKTGWFRDYHKSDAEFYAACTIKAYNFGRINAQYWYIDNPQSSFGLDVSMKDAPSLLMRWASLFQSAEMAIDQGRTPESDGPHCRWCQVKACSNYRGK